jgi:hypothetical protein
MMAPDPTTNSTKETPSQTGRVLISLLLFAHLFFVVVALAANLAPSQLQSRILSRFAFYTQTLNLDLSFTPYYLTHAGPEDVDHRIEVLPADESPDDDDAWTVLPDVGRRGSERYHRYQRLARVMSFFSRDDETAARVATAVGASYLHQRDIRPQRVRCRKHMLQSWTAITGGTSAQRDPDDPTYFQVVYDANYVISATGGVGVVKLAGTGEVAQPTQRGSEQNATDP